ncbi:DUF2065 domain-containing protein [Pseudoalteromonas sp. NBT06-2]|uniref:DUF2065 domain-containing protein n=1 Tax=Pseudoalteromonas sp. NBT06-2 TaxID=2025950 RepID=UPI000BA74A77|nr:DUF2065 domain-containing protein [Pseudoalteromonas sp. NBT06-2]PAJ72487.1 DUF2065 domain-containing protein [Pseudoalteromonas sp. NBT06-2]
MTFDSLWLALAMFLIFEGLGPALFPNKWKQYLAELSNQPSKNLRIIGITLILMGWFLFLFMRS